MKEGTSAVLLQSDLDEKWRGNSEGMLLFSAKLSTSCQMGKLLLKSDFGEPFKGPIIPSCGNDWILSDMCTSESKLHQFGKKVLLGIFLGCALTAGGIWKGDTVVADNEELENLDASEIRARRLNANCLEEIMESVNPL